MKLEGKKAKKPPKPKRIETSVHAPNFSFLMFPVWSLFHLLRLHLMTGDH